MSTEYDKVTGEASVNVLHEFYYKDVASKTVVNSRSAIHEKAKRTILTQEVIRIMRNCSRLLPWKEVCGHIDEFCMRMQYSGYTKAFRAQVIRTALHA